MRIRTLPGVLASCALPLLSASALGQATGVSHPDGDETTTTVTQTQTDHYVKPTHNGSANDAVQVRTQTTVTAPETAASAVSTPDSYPGSYPATGPAPVVTSQTSQTSQTSVAAGQSSDSSPALIERRPLPVAHYESTESARAEAARREPGNDDGIVLSVPEHPHELHAGTVLKVRLDQRVSTEETRVGTRFSAQLLEPLGHSGEIMLPAGSTILGRVTKVHGGKRITGAAAIRLQPETVNLPDGTSYRLAATVSGLEGYTDSHVNGEGTILAKTHPEIDAAALGLTTGAAAVTGAVIGGGVGAAVGAGIGAGVGTYLWLNRDHEEELPAGTGLLLSLDEPLHVNPR